MTTSEIFPIVGVIIVGIGLIVTWVRNGRSQSKRDGVLEERIKSIKDKLEDKNNGLGAIKTSVEDQKVHCAKVTSSFTERIKNLEKD